MSLSVLTQSAPAPVPVENATPAPAATINPTPAASSAPTDTVSISPAAHQAAAAGDPDHDGH